MSKSYVIDPYDISRRAPRTVCNAVMMLSFFRYEFAVAAYNRDLETFEIYVGEETVATPPKSDTQWIVPVVISSVILAVIAVSLGVFFCRRRRTHFPRFRKVAK